MFAAIDELTISAPSADEAADRLLALVDLVFAIRQDGISVYKCSAIYETFIFPQGRLYEGLFAGGLEMDVDSRRRVQIALERCGNWDEEWELEELEARFATQLEFAPTVAYAAARRLADGTAVACVGPMAGGRSGPVAVTIQHGSCLVPFVTTDETRLQFYRDAIEVEDPDEAGYFRYATIAFPELVFVDGLAQQYRRFSRPYRAIRPDVTKHLAAINDCWRVAFSGFPDPSVISARMHSCGGIDISPESPVTRANRAAWAERRISWRGGDVYCDWHSKITIVADRIHFHPAAESGSRLLIGIFAEHLST